MITNSILNFFGELNFYYNKIRKMSKLVFFSILLLFLLFSVGGALNCYNCVDIYDVNDAMEKQIMLRKFKISHPGLEKISVCSKPIADSPTVYAWSYNTKPFGSIGSSCISLHVTQNPTPAAFSLFSRVRYTLRTAVSKGSCVALEKEMKLAAIMYKGISDFSVSCDECDTDKCNSRALKKLVENPHFTDLSNQKPAVNNVIIDKSNLTDALKQKSAEHDIINGKPNLTDVSTQKPAVHDIFNGRPNLTDVISNKKRDLNTDRPAIANVPKPYTNQLGYCSLTSSANSVQMQASFLMVFFFLACRYHWSFLMVFVLSCVFLKHYTHSFLFEYRNQY